MFDIFGILGVPLGWVMWQISRVIDSYALALFVFTVLINVLLFPLNLKQQKSSAKMAKIQPELKELQEKYKDDREQLQQKMMELYRREKYNPASGCLPLFIQMPILFGMISVIYSPLTHLLRLPQSTVSLAQDILARLYVGQTFRGLDVQLAVISAINENPNAFYAIGPNALSAVSALDMTFLGIDLTVVPNPDMLFGGAWNPVVLIPFLSGASALVVSLIMMRFTAANPNNAAMPGGAASMKMMMYVMPVFSVMFAFSVAGGVGLYWLYANIVSIGRTLLVNKIYNPAEMARKAKEEFDQRKEQEKQERQKEKAEAKKRVKEGTSTEADKEKAMSAKELARKKLAEARQRDAEKYGEEYVEVTDADLR